MGLDLQVGVLAELKGMDDELLVSVHDTQQFEIINKAFRAEGLAEHVEPREADEHLLSNVRLRRPSLPSARRCAPRVRQANPPPGDLVRARIRDPIGVLATVRDRGGLNPSI